jgi:hypothetical protein
MSQSFHRFSHLRQECDTPVTTTLHVECGDVWSPPSALTSQSGKLFDGSEYIEFVAYEDSNATELVEGRAYTITDARIERDPLIVGLTAVILPQTRITETSSDASGLNTTNRRFSHTPDCTACGEQIPISGYHEDGLAPEIGWTYWVCDTCNHKMRPPSNTDE